MCTQISDKMTCMEIVSRGRGIRSKVEWGGGGGAVKNISSVWFLVILVFFSFSICMAIIII